MRIALVWPYGFDPKYVMPLALGYLKSNLNSEKYDVRIIDNSLRDRRADSPEFARDIEEFDPHIVGISTWSPTFEETLHIARVVKAINSDIVTIVGGAHATSYAHKVMAHVVFDYIFRGEAELSLPVLLEELRQDEPDLSKVLGLVYRNEKSGGVVQNEMERVDDIDIIGYPDYEAMDLDGYHRAGYRWNTPEQKNAPIWATRGCPYRCTFCAAPAMNGKPVRKHSVEYMVQWVEYLYHQKGIRWFNIIDDNFTFDKRYAKTFCEAIINLKLKGLGFGTPNGIRMNKGGPELWRLMKMAGWRTLIVAPESGSENTLKIMKKDLDLQIVPRVVDEIRKAGIKVQAFFILGYPGERPEDIEKTANFIKQCRFDFVFMNNFQPLPGTPVYDELVAQGKIEDGLMPINYSDGVRVYTPPELRNFNFPRFILKTYFLMALRNPMNIPYMITLFNPMMLARKLYSNFMSMLGLRRANLQRHSAPSTSATINEDT